MSSLTDLTTQLTTDVPSLNGTPSQAQYTQAVKDAVADLGRRLPLVKVATLSIISGTASYALPTGFVRLIRLASLSDMSGVLITSSGLVPLSTSLRERHTIAAGQITFHPTPAYTLERELVYAASYVLSGDSYAELDDDRAQIAMRKARALALSLQAAKAAADAWLHELGPERVDKTRQAGELRSSAQAWQDQYEAAVRMQTGPIGMRS